MPGVLSTGDERPGKETWPRGVESPSLADPTPAGSNQRVFLEPIALVPEAHPRSAALPASPDQLVPAGFPATLPSLPPPQTRTLSRARSGRRQGSGAAPPLTAQEARPGPSGPA